MSKLLLYSHNGFSDENANGITMKNLLSAWPAAEKAEFYCDVQSPDFSAAHQYFRVTDVELMKSFLGRCSRRVFAYSQSETAVSEKTSGRTGASVPKKIPHWLKKQKYNFVFRWIREWMRMIGPWGQRDYETWLRDVAPDVLVYMVGESLFMDRLVLRAVQETGKPLVLYNGEAFRIIDIKKRKGLERAYYRRAEKLYGRLNDAADLVIYNSDMLQRSFEAMYPSRVKSIVAHNSAEFKLSDYKPGENVKITYFGNLGVGRSDALMETAEIIREIDPELRLDIYGNASPEAEMMFCTAENIRYHGFVNADSLRKITEESDILFHVESFESEIMERLKYAFSTKIAQCLCAGRSFLSYAPEKTASTQYLLSCGGALVATDRTSLKQILQRLCADPTYRCEWALKAQGVGRKNHSMEATAARIREEIEQIMRR